jgi:hypothetical protein
MLEEWKALLFRRSSGNVSHNNTDKPQMFMELSLLIRQLICIIPLKHQKNLGVVRSCYYPIILMMNLRLK